MSKKLRKKLKKIIKEQITDINPSPIFPIADPPGPGPGPNPGSGFDPGEAEEIPDKTIPVLKPDNNANMTTWVIESATPNTGTWVSYGRSSCNRSGGKLPKRKSKIRIIL